MATRNLLLSKQFKTQYPFESFYPKHRQVTNRRVINNIDHTIIAILNDVKRANIEFDVAFIEINCLVQYITSFINNTRDDYANDLCTGYYKFLFHFLIYGCCLSNKYTKYMVLNSDDKHYKSNKVLRYCIDNILPHIHRSNIKYKYNNSQRTAIINGVTNHLYHKVETITNNIEYNVAELIADFTAYHFEEFFCGMMEFCHDWMLCPQRSEIWHMYCCADIHYLFIMPQLLISPPFISIDDNDLEHFANQTLFLRSVQMISIPFWPDMIRRVFKNMSMKPWIDSLAFVELFETLERRYNKKHNAQYIVKLFEKCINGMQSDIIAPVLSVFYNGNNEDIVNYTVENRYIECIYNNVDFFFSAFVDKYCIRNTKVLLHLLRQIINSLIYFYSNKFITNQHIELKNKLIEKLYDYMMVKLVKNIGYDDFIQIAKSDSWQILDALHKTDRYQVTAGALKGDSRGAVSWIIGLQAIPVLFKRLLSNPQVFGQLLRRYNRRTKFSQQALQLTAAFIDQLQETNLFHHLQSNPEILIDLIHRCQSRLQQNANSISK